MATWTFNGKRVSPVTGCLGMIFIIAIMICALMAFSGVAVGAANSWVFGGNFIDGWNKAWENPGALFGWACVFVVIPQIRLVFGD